LNAVLLHYQTSTSRWFHFSVLLLTTHSHAAVTP